jgi:hypothetical protein
LKTIVSSRRLMQTSRYSPMCSRWTEMETVERRFSCPFVIGFT